MRSRSFAAVRLFGTALGVPNAIVTLWVAWLGGSLTPAVLAFVAVQIALIVCARALRSRLDRVGGVLIVAGATPLGLGNLLGLGLHRGARPDGGLGLCGVRDVLRGARGPRRVGGRGRHPRRVYRSAACRGDRQAGGHRGGLGGDTYSRAVCHVDRGGHRHPRDDDGRPRRGLRAGDHGLAEAAARERDERTRPPRVASAAPPGHLLEAQARGRIHSCTQPWKPRPTNLLIVDRHGTVRGANQRFYDDVAHPAADARRTPATPSCSTWSPVQLVDPGAFRDKVRDLLCAAAWPRATMS